METQIDNANEAKRRLDKSTPDMGSTGYHYYWYRGSHFMVGLWH